jgi:hypothetical protein
MPGGFGRGGRGGRHESASPGRNALDVAQEKEKAVGNNRCSDYEASRPCAAASCDGNGEQGQAGLAQLVEHVICNHGVTGSNPVAGTT